MTNEEKNQKVKELRERIIDLKYRETSSTIRTKKTIQKLQQEIDSLLYD
mgnify:CR=1 FL=1